MSETLSAILELQIGGFSQALQQAASQVQQFAQSVASQVAQATQSITRITQAMQQQAQAATGVTQATAHTTQTQQASTQSTNQLAAAYIAMAQAIQQQTQGYTQAQAAALKFRQEQAILSAETRKAAQEARAAGDIWRQIFAVAGGIGLITSIQGLISGFKSLVVDSAKTAVEMQSLTASFQAVKGSAAGAQQSLAFVRAEANRIGIDFVGAAQSFKGLEAAAKGTTLEGVKARDIFTAVAEASRVMGLSGDQTKHVLIAIEQMMSKGKVSAEELRRQMGNFLPGAFEIAARSMGLTTAQLDKMLRTGELLSEDFLPKFARQLRQELGPGLEKAAETAAATFARLGNEVQRVAQRIGEATLKIFEPIAKFISATLKQASDAVDKSKQEIARTGKEVIAGRPVFGETGTTLELAAGFTEAEAAKATVLVEKIASLRRIAAGSLGAGPATKAIPLVTQL